MIIPIWQPEAGSSHQLARDAGKLLGQATTHTGTLDPMASGVLVLLSGEDRFSKGLLEWDKTYDFSIVWGIETDSGDTLGLITKESEQPEPQILETVLAQMPRQYSQQIPNFSARRVSGTSAFDLARTATVIEPAYQNVQLSHISLVGSRYIPASKLVDAQQARIQKVAGNFRQQEIITNWQEQIDDNKQFLCTEHSVTTSRRTYIRQLVQDIAAQTDSAAVTWSITRTRNGPFFAQDCLELAELTELA